MFGCNACGVEFEQLGACPACEQSDEVYEICQEDDSDYAPVDYEQDLIDAERI